MGGSSFRIVVRTGSEAGKSFPLPGDGVVRVGSSRPCQILLASPGVLGVHCFLKCAGGRVALIVQDEKAQVLVNGANARRKLLAAGDTIQAGEAIFVVEAVEKDPLLGETVGGYRVDAFIGGGAMGTVYKATQLSLDRTVALKILSPELTKNAAFVSKFLEEAKAAAKLNHPNVVQVYDAAAAPAPVRKGDGAEAAVPGGAGSPQIFFFSMEHMAGGTLQQLLDKEGKISIEKALAIGCDTARALVWAEEHGIVHRDIKPANLLFAANGSVKVADLGIAADIDRMMEGVDGLQGAGSPRYMAPEQAQRKGVDHRADIYALGSTLFRAIAGRHVFEGKTSADVVKAKTTEDAPRLDAVAPETPSEVADFIARMLSREISGRPRTCAETLAGLDACLAAVRDGATDQAVDDAPHAESFTAGRRSRSRGGRTSEGQGSAWGEFVASTAGVLSLSTSAMFVVLALVWPVPTTTPVPDAGDPGAMASLNAGAQRPPATGRNGGSTREDGEPALPEPAPPARKPRKDTTPEPELAGVGDPAILRELGSILSEYRSGLIDSRRALAAIEDFKRKHPGPEYAARADRQLNLIRDGLLEAGKNALSRFVNGDLRGLLEQSEYREAINRLVKLGETHAFNLKEINAEIQGVEDAARGVFKKAEEEADRAAALGDFAGAIAALKRFEGTMPLNIQPTVTERIAGLAKDEKEYAQLAAPFAQQLEAVQDAIAGLDFDRAASQAAALPQPKNAVLSKRRAAIAGEVQCCRAAWDALVAASKRAGKNGDTQALLSPPSRDLLAMLGGTPPADQVEGLGLLLLHSQGPERAKELLLDARLGSEKTAVYKVRLAEEEEAYLSRHARKLAVRIDKMRAEKTSSPEEWEALAVDILRRIGSARSAAGYEKARSALARAFLQAKAEVLRASVPGSLLHGKIKSYKPDGSIELVYDFNSDDEFKDFVPVRSASSRLELEGKMAKIRGEFRLGRGDVFRNRLGVTGKLPPNGYSPQAPNMNVALWTRDDDRVSPVVRKTTPLDTEGDEKPRTAEGVPDDYFAFGAGYKARLPAGSSSDALLVKGSGASVPMPANALLGGIRGEALHSSTEGDCFWAKAAGKVSGAQAFRVQMALGALTWTINSHSVLAARDMKDVEVLKRSDPYTGSVTFFTNGEVLFYDSILIEGELNPAWVEEQLLAIAEGELKKVEPDYPFGNR